MAEQQERIKRIEFENFKALRAYSVTIGDINVLVGPNNSGKSTIIGALRTLDAAVRYARTRAPLRVYAGDTGYLGYRIPEDSVPISLENVQHDYKEVDARVVFHLSNRNRLSLVFPEEGGCLLVPEADGEIITSAAGFKRAFPLSLIIVPVLGPVEHNERLRDRSTVVAGLTTHRASRHFRSYWRHNPGGFEEFAAQIARTWPGMEIMRPDVGLGGDLTMFCREGRMLRELYWVGFGFQIWCQLLTHLSRVTANSLVVVDEPEVYLHPDVQRQLLGILRDVGADVLLATHSSEIIAEADPNEIVMVDKLRSTGQRLTSASNVQRALEAVGSAHNLTLTALAKSRRILFVEGLEDFRLLRRFARKLGLQELSAGTGIIPLKSGGFGSWRRITHIADGISEALGAELMIGAVFDRDYYCAEEIEAVNASLGASLELAHVFERKEIENYLLAPIVLERALERAFRDHSARSSNARRLSGSVADLLEEITAPMKAAVLSQGMARRDDYHKGRPNSSDRSIQYKAALDDFDSRWVDLNSRLALASGKTVLHQLRERIQADCGVSLSNNRIAEAMTRADFPQEVSDLLHALDTFRAKPVASK